MTQQESAEFAPSKPFSVGDSGGVGWKLALFVLGLGLIVLILIYWDTAVSMYDLWSEVHAYNHAFLILPVCLFLVWERRHILASLQPRPNLLGPLAVFAFGALWLVSDTVDVAVGRQVALVGMAEGLVLATLGWRIFGKLIFPLFYVWLIIPVDLGLLPGLQKLATIASAWGIGSLGIPTFVEGVFIELPTGRYWVAPGCAGLNYLLSGFALSLLYGEQMYNGWAKRITCVVVMILVAIVANWIRIFGLIAAGHYFNQIYDINDHYTEGWLFFAVIVFVMMWIGMRFRDPLSDQNSSIDTSEVSSRNRSTSAVVTYLAIAIVSIAGSMAFPAYAAYRLSGLPPAVDARIEFPAKIGDWRLTDERSNWEPSFRGADAQSTRRYSNGSASVDIYISYFARQGDGREVVARKNRVYDSEIWKRLRSGGAKAHVGAVPVDLAVTYLQSHQRRRVVWHAYWVDGTYTRDTMKAKLFQAKAELLVGDRRAGFIAVSSENIDDPVALAAILRSLPSFESLVASGAAGG